MYSAFIVSSELQTRSQNRTYQNEIAKNTITSNMKMMSNISDSFSQVSTVKREYQPESQKVLSCRQADDARLYFRASKKASIRSARVVTPVLQPQDRIGLAER